MSEARQSVVLAGAGNAHLKFIRTLAMQPIGPADVTLINRTSKVVYSAMAPRYLSGECDLTGIQIDLGLLCRSQGIKFVLGEIKGLNPTDKILQIYQRGDIPYDVLSLSMGSVPSGLEKLKSVPNVISIKPLETLLERLDLLKAASGLFRVAVVGAGASGVEIVLALARRFRAEPSLSLTLIQAEEVILPKFPLAVRRAAESALKKARIEVRCRTRVVGARGTALLMENGTVDAFGATILATEGAPPPVLRVLGLEVDSNGFLQVDRDLRVKGHREIFAAGDCVSISGLPEIPRNGVYAVREGEKLFENVASLLRGERPSRYRPQKKFLSLLNLADGTAALAYGGTGARGRWVRALKASIDRAWIDGFKDLSNMSDGSSMEKMEEMRCGGCGSKVPSAVLTAALEGLPIPEHPSVLVGCRQAEDAAVQVPPEGQVEVQTVDFFKAFVDDKELFGRLAAMHAATDILAMNATPFSALTICTLPPSSPGRQQRDLTRLMEGALETFKELGVTLTGGHTTEASELTLGFAVTGYGRKEELFHKRALAEGDQLILTKPLGTGALLASQMREQGRVDWYEAMYGQMLRSNAEATRIFARHGVRACTDISGFGLVGHLYEMVKGTALSIEVEGGKVPLLLGFSEVVASGVLSTLHSANDQAATWLTGRRSAWLFDPQTCGGLVAAVGKSKATAALEQLHQAGYAQAAIIGEVRGLTPSEEAGILVR